MSGQDNPGTWQAHTSFPSGASRPSQPHPIHSNGPPDPQNWQAHTSYPSFGHRHAPASETPAADTQNSAPASRQGGGGPTSSSEAVLANLPDRGEQFETMQTYEASAKQTEEDRDQETLVKEFPRVDSTLIAAIYSDSKSLNATRETLQAMGDNS